MLVAILMALFFSVPNQQIGSPYPNNTTALVIKADIINCSNTPPIVEKKQALLPIDIVKKYFDPNLFWDEKLHRIVITSKNKVVKMNLNSNTISVNNKLLPCVVPAKSINGTIYIPINFLKNIYGINITINNDLNVIVIDYNHKTSRQGQVIQLISQIRKNKLISSPIVKKLMFGDKLEVFAAYKDWYKVRSKEGIIGFIEAQYVQLTPNVASKSKTKPGSLKDVHTQKLSLAWDQSLNIDSINKIDGLQILSPTWFSVSDINGTVKSKANINYVKKAHQSGYKVWALFSNSFSPIISSRILNDGLLKDKVINQIVTYAKTYNLDGINIDFENINLKDKDMYSQFVRELAPMLRAQGKVVSVDVGTPDGSENFSRCFDLKALADAVDYVALMTYDQHWSTCSYSGSVAQYSWVEDKLQATLKKVPSTKLLLGLPFYTRGWKEDIDSSGSTKATQYKVFSMKGAKTEVKINNAEVRWANESGQFYAQFSKDNSIYKIWLEDNDSINLKSSLVYKYNLAGVAIWEKTYATPDVWEVLKKNLHKTRSYAGWIKDNTELYSRQNTYFLSKR